MRRRAGGSGRLFGSVGPADIAAAVREAQAAPSSTGAGSRSATRSRPWARTRCGSGCTPRSAPPSTSRSRPASPSPGLSPSSGAGVSPAPLACVRSRVRLRTPAGRPPDASGRPDLGFTALERSGSGASWRSSWSGAPECDADGVGVS